MWFPNRSVINRAAQAQKQARSLKLKRKCTIRVAKTKALISFAVTAKLICVFVFAYADCWFSHGAAHLIKNVGNDQEKAWEVFHTCRSSEICPITVPILCQEHFSK